MKRSRRVARAIGVVIVMSALSACAVGPDYVRPDASVPAQFKQAEGWKPAQPGDAQARGPWWIGFGDPDLNALMVQVEQANQDVRAAEARYRQAVALARQARSSLFPTVNANATVTRSRGSTTSGDGGTSRIVNTRQADLSLDWELDLWGRVRRSVESNEASAQANRADLASTVLSLQAELAQNYFALRVADAQRALFDESIAAFERSLQLTQNRYAAGVVTRADVAQAQTQLLSARTQATDLNLQRAQLEHAIAVLMGLAPSQLNIVPKAFALALPDVPAVLPSALLERRPDVAAAERRVAAANAQIGVARAAYFPTLSLSASGGYRGVGAGDLLSLPTRVWSVGPALAETLFDAGRRRAVEDQSIAVYDENVAAYRGTVLTALQDTENALASLRLLDLEAQTQDQAVQAAQESLTLTINQYKAGTVGFLNVITAQTTELTTRRSALDIAGRRYTAAVQLIKALGGGWNGLGTEETDGPTTSSTTAD